VTRRGKINHRKFLLMLPLIKKLRMKLTNFWSRRALLLLEVN